MIRVQGQRRRFHVYCTQWASCGWTGVRTADEQKAVLLKPCPRCGKEVVA